MNGNEKGGTVLPVPAGRGTLIQQIFATLSNSNLLLKSTPASLIHSPKLGNYMINFVVGVITGVIANGLCILAGISWPSLLDRLLYRGIRIAGKWEILECRNNEEKAVGKIELYQIGKRITGIGERQFTREGSPSNRKFTYEGRFTGEQLVLIFQDQSGSDFDCGTYVFRVMNNRIEMRGIATFNGRNENRIIAEERRLLKLPD